MSQSLYNITKIEMNPPTNYRSTMAEQLTLPIATLIAGETMETDNDYKEICEKVKHIRDQVSEFYETEPEFNEAIGPIEQDPQSFTSGKPILKKYAHALLEKMEHERQMEAEEEAKRDKHLTPQQVKADLKHYVSTCEKKIVQQQEQCDALQKQVEQLMDVVKCIVTHPMYDTDFARDMLSLQLGDSYHQWVPSREPISLLTFSIEKNMPNVQDFLLEQGVKCDGKIKNSGDNEHLVSSLHYACYKNDFPCVKKLLTTTNINTKSVLIKDKRLTHKTRWNGPSPNNPYDTLISLLEIASNNGSLDMVKLLVKKGATIGDTTYKVPNGPEGDLVAGYLQTHGSKPVTRF